MKIRNVRSTEASHGDSELGPRVAAAVAQLVSAPAAVNRRAHRAAELIRAATGRRWVGIYAVREHQVENLAWSGVGPPAHPVFALDEGLTATAIATGRTVVSNNVAADPRYLTNQAATGSELIVPILSEWVLGTLDVEDASIDAFDGKDQRVFEQIATALIPLYEVPQLGA